MKSWARGLGMRPCDGCGQWNKSLLEDTMPWYVRAMTQEIICIQTLQASTKLKFLCG